MRTSISKKFFVFWFTLISILANFDFFHFHTFLIKSDNHKVIKSHTAGIEFSTDKCLLDFFLLILSNIILAKTDFQLFLKNLSIAPTYTITFYPRTFVVDYVPRAPPILQAS